MGKRIWDDSFGEIGATLQILEKLGVENTDFARIRQEAKVAEEVAEVLKRTCLPEHLLNPVGTVAISATTGQFSAELCFRLGNKVNGLPKISYLGNNFKDWFLNGDGKTEEPIGAIVLQYQKLCRGSVDGPIIAALGGEAKAETMLTEVFDLMSRQKNGETGVLLTNGDVNIFYVKDQNGVLRAVSVHWLSGGWRVSANSVENPRWWIDGRQVFSRNSVLEPSVTPALTLI